MCTRHLLRVALCCPQDSLPRICNLCERHSIPLGCFLPQRYSCRSLCLDNPGGAAGLPAHCPPAFCARVLDQRQRLTSVFLSHSPPYLGQVSAEPGACQLVQEALGILMSLSPQHQDHRHTSSHVVFGFWISTLRSSWLHNNQLTN